MKIKNFMDNKLIRNYIYNYAKENGSLIYEDYQIRENGNLVTKKRISGYRPNDPNKYVVIILDHIRRCQREKGYSIKENMDKMSSYQVEMRNLFSYIFVNVVHLNRSISNIDRIKFNEDQLFPTADDIKDSGRKRKFLILFFNIIKYRNNIFTTKMKILLDKIEIRPC